MKSAEFVVGVATLIPNLHSKLKTLYYKNEHIKKNKTSN